MAEKQLNITKNDFIVYYASKDTDKINFLGENGWYIFCQQPTIIAHDFKMEEGDHLNNLKKWLDERANAGEDERKFLNKAGFHTRIMKSDGFKGRKFVITDFSALLDWRIEFDYNEDKPIVYVTFGPERMAAPAIASKEVIDKYVPKEILEKALEFGSLYEDYAREEVSDA